jgi:hypothetical protein
MNFFTVSATTLKWLFRLWPPLWFTGIRFEHISADFRHVRTAMPLRLYNKNLHGLQFGGNLYTMTDPCYLMMVLRNLGKDYRVLDKSAYIDFIKPGTSTVVANFYLTDADLEDIRQHTNNGEKYFKEFSINITDQHNTVVAKVIKTIYIRKKVKH